MQCLLANPIDCINIRAPFSTITEKGNETNYTTLLSCLFGRLLQYVYFKKIFFSKFSQRDALQTSAAIFQHTFMQKIELIRCIMLPIDVITSWNILRQHSKGNPSLVLRRNHLQTEGRTPSQIYTMVGTLGRRREKVNKKANQIAAFQKALKFTIRGAKKRLVSLTV